jgi:hypothetical protein
MIGDTVAKRYFVFYRTDDDGFVEEFNIGEEEKLAARVEEITLLCYSSHPRNNGHRLLHVVEGDDVTFEQTVTTKLCVVRSPIAGKEPQ